MTSQDFFAYGKTRFLLFLVLYHQKQVRPTHQQKHFRIRERQVHIRRLKMEIVFCC